MSIGPTLPPHLQQKMAESGDDSSSGEDEKVGPKLPQAPKTTTQPSGRTAIGPTLPPHLQRQQRDEESDSDDDEAGPRLPEVACRGPIPQEIENEEESSDDDFGLGPALPPHLAARLAPAAEADPGEEDESSDDDGGCIGPRPPAPGDNSSSLLSQMSDIERRAKNMKEKIEGKDKEVLKRENWMLELPEANAKNFGLGARTFRRKAATSLGDRSAWTDNPEEREKRARGEIEEKPEEDDQLYLVNKARDEAMAKVTEDLKKKRGTESLVDLHDKKLQKKQKKEKKKSKKDEEPQGRRPFDRDLDLGANKFDDAQRKLMIKKSAEINSRFAAGAQKFL